MSRKSKHQVVNYMTTVAAQSRGMILMLEVLEHLVIEELDNAHMQGASAAYIGRVGRVQETLSKAILESGKVDW